MTRKDQIKILNDKIKSNINQYKIDRLNAEISAFSCGELNKYEFLTKKDLKYKPNALDKARFEFSPLGKAFSTGLDKTAEGYQEEGVIKLLKYIRGGIAGNVIRPNNRLNRFNDDNNDDNNDNNNDDNNNDNNGDNNDDRPDRPDRLDDDNTIDNRINNLKDKILDLETKLKNSELSNEEKDKLNKKLHGNNEELEKFIELYDDIVKEDKDKIYNISNKFKNNMKNNINDLNKKFIDEDNNFNARLNELNDKISKIKYTIKNNKALTNAERNKLQNKIKDLTTQRDSINNEHRHAVNAIKKLKKEK